MPDPEVIPLFAGRSIAALAFVVCLATALPAISAARPAQDMFLMRTDVFVPVSQQPETGLQARYLAAYRRVRRERAGDRRRNLLRQGVRTPGGLVRGVKKRELRRELGRLRDLLATAARKRRKAAAARHRREAAAAAAARAQASASQTAAPSPSVPAQSAAPAASGQLESIAQCESGGNPAAIGGGGTYRGKYQFTQSTWQSVGGSGDPAAAPEAEQDRRAAMLLAQGGAGQWPICGG